LWGQVKDWKIETCSFPC